MRALLLLLVTSALASDGRGWTEGRPAAQTAKVLAGMGSETSIQLPKDLVARITGPTVLFYFSPTCPHCRAVGHEVTALARTLDGRAAILGVASGSSTEADILEFRTTFDADWPIVHDKDREIGSAIQARSTPSALWVVPKDRDHVEVRDLWYPYLPGFDALVEGRVRGEPFAAFHPGIYQGDNVCGSCHGTEYASLGLQHHSIAWRTLVLRDKHTDAACTHCHVTGAGQPTGWTPEEPHGPLVNVGCEACHGPGGPHDGTRTDARSTCEGCHDAKHAIAFTVEKGLPLIDHYVADHLTPKAVQARRAALVDGTASRDLLAFAEGRNLGAEACKECHPASYDHWKASPHARAMEVLVREQKADDVGCARCHATAKAAGPPPTHMGGFRVEESVSCESCHGPGEAHVAAGGGTDTIERLGDDCPVCVIEAVCTSCHVQSWDPDWNLETDLPRVRHPG